MRQQGVKGDKGDTGFNPRICKRCDLKRMYRLHDGFCFNPRICKRCDFKWRDF